LRSQNIKSKINKKYKIEKQIKNIKSKINKKYKIEKQIKIAPPFPKVLALLKVDFFFSRTRKKKSNLLPAAAL
jgi:hypothetical protein